MVSMSSLWPRWPNHVAQANKRTAKPVVADLADLQTVVRLAATAKIDDPAEAVWAALLLANSISDLAARRRHSMVTSRPRPTQASPGSTSARCSSRCSFSNSSATNRKQWSRSRRCFSKDWKNYRIVRCVSTKS